MTRTAFRTTADVLDGHPEGISGCRSSVSPHNRSISVINGGRRAKTIRTITVSGSVNGTTYSIPVVDPSTGLTIATVTATGGASDAATATAIAAAWNADPVARGRATVSRDTAILTFTATWPGLDFSFGTLVAALTAALVLAGSNADRIPFGRFVVKGFENDGAGGAPDYYGPTPEGGLPVAALMPPNRVVKTVTYSSGAKVSGRVRIPALGEVFEIADVTMATDLATSAAAIAAAFNAAIPANRVVVTNDAGAITFENEIPLLGFEVDLYVVSGSATVTSTSTAGMSFTPETFGLGFALARRADAQPASLDVDDLAYEPGEVMEINARGPMWLDKPSGMLTSDLVPGGIVWIGTDSGNEGKVYHAASGANRFPLRAASFARFATVATDLVEINYSTP